MGVYYTEYHSLPETILSVVGPNDHLETHCNTFQHTTTLQCTVTYTVTHYTMLQHAATRGNTRQHAATRGNIRQHITTFTATRCKTLQHTATHCKTLQHAVTHSITLQHQHTIGSGFVPSFWPSECMNSCVPKVSLTLHGSQRSPRQRSRKPTCFVFTLSPCATETLYGLRQWIWNLGCCKQAAKCRCLTLFRSCALQHTAMHCKTLQHSATHRNTLQHTATDTATHSNALPLPETVLVLPHTLCLIPCALPM